MATVGEIGRDLLASIGTDAGLPLAAKWISNRYVQLVSRARFRHLRQIGELTMPAIVNDGTVTITQASTTVTGDTDTTWATSPATGDHEYWYLLVGNVWYKVASVTDDDTLVLDTAFAGDSVEEVTYRLVKRYHPLDAAARWLGDFVHDRLRLPLAKRSIEELNIIAPGRPITGAYPRIVAQNGVDSNGYVRVEIYPPPSDPEIIRYAFWDLPTALTISSTIPAQIDGYMLKEGALIDAYRHEKARSLRAGNVEAAAVWRNDENVQRTIWERTIQEACRTDRGEDDISLILQLARNAGGGGYEYRRARDIVASRSWD